VWAEVAAAAHDDAGARAYLVRHPDEATEVECAAIGDPADIDTAADLSEAATRLPGDRDPG
jgi:CTP:molybdopterin cytidylyltransferase MocA